MTSMTVAAATVSTVIFRRILAAVYIRMPIADVERCLAAAIG